MRDREKSIQLLTKACSHLSLQLPEIPTTSPSSSTGNRISIISVSVFSFPFDLRFMESQVATRDATTTMATATPVTRLVRQIRQRKTATANSFAFLTVRPHPSYKGGTWFNPVIDYQILPRKEVSCLSTSCLPLRTMILRGAFVAKQQETIYYPSVFPFPAFRIDHPNRRRRRRRDGDKRESRQHLNLDCHCYRRRHVASSLLRSVVVLRVWKTARREINTIFISIFKLSSSLQSFSRQPAL